MRDSNSKRKTAARGAFFLLLGGIVFVTLSPIELRPKTGHVVAERAAAFLLLGGAAALAWPARLLKSALAVVMIAGALEMSQTLIPGRHGRIQDAIQKAAGGAAGAALVGLGSARLRRREDVGPD